ncbi:FAM98 family protein [Brachybacterium sp. ACRRE]|uniref:FAM98 family protein n=1 Tax=Brachybacterium sp. ACRRE TaxID=2918184 RepID=UPI001EF1EB17|nr:FAM98 family protein [Brachybacterium sp. ACRRE]MCG7308768.1 FAM98 family protein [Brachybacterium sp. ACRRE]
MDTVGHPGSRVRAVHPERTVRRERDRIRAGLLLRAPGLERRIVETSSGSLLVRFPAATASTACAGSADGIEIGRLPDRGGASWVVVVRRQGRASVRRCASVEQVVRSALIGLRSARAA